MVDYSRLHPRLRNIAARLPKVAASYGFQAKVTSAYRSPAKQKALYQKFLAGQMPYTVAPPGQSLHEKGLALDVVSTDTKKLVALLKSAGLSWAGKTDPVHFQLKGLRGPEMPKKKSIFKKILSVASFIPGPIGLAATGAGFIVKR